MTQGAFSEEMELEACRLPASIGAGILMGAVSPDDINVFQTTAYNVTLTCYQMYHSMASGTLLFSPPAIAWSDALFAPAPFCGACRVQASWCP